MKIFLSDLWNDLREKRLWPVALVLLAGVVAVPFVMAKKSEEPVVAPPAPTAKTEAPEDEGPAALAEVKLSELAEGTGSSLSSFDPSNPFAPPRKVLEAARREAGGGSGPSVEAADDGSAGGSAGGGTPTDDDGDTGGTTGGDVGGDNGGDTGGGEKTTTFTYVIDATFFANGRRRKIEGMRKLDILPNESSPLLIFLGVTENAGNAVFLVDSTLQTAGEGSCKPSKADCAFLYLGAGSEHEFTNDDGDSFRLRVDEIRRVKVGAKKSAGAAKKKNKSASAAVGQPAPARRFTVPLLADLVSVSSGSDDTHDNDGDSR